MALLGRLSPSRMIRCGSCRCTLRSLTTVQRSGMLRTPLWGADLSMALEDLSGAYFSISFDISRTDPLVLIRRADCLLYAHRKDATALLTYVDDLIWITESSQGLPRILASIFLLELLDVPFAWHKFRGGAEMDGSGFRSLLTRGCWTLQSREPTG